MTTPEYIETMAVVEDARTEDSRVREKFEQVVFSCSCGWKKLVFGGEKLPFKLLSHGILLARCPDCSEVFLGKSPDLNHRWWVDERFGKTVTPSQTPSVEFVQSVPYDSVLVDHGSDAAVAICSAGHLTCVGSHTGAVIRQKTGEYGPFRTVDSTISLDDSLVVSGTEPGFVSCSDCGEARHITSDGIDANDEGHHILTLCDGHSTPYRVDGTANGDKMCPTCGNYGLSEYLNRDEGPENPEVGWEYYECDVCGNTHSPDALLNIDDPFSRFESQIEHPISEGE